MNPPQPIPPQNTTNSSPLKPSLTGQSAFAQSVPNHSATRQAHCSEMKGLFVGTMEPEQWLTDYLHYQEGLQIPELQFTEMPTPSRSKGGAVEADMYDPFVSICLLRLP